MEYLERRILAWLCILVGAYFLSRAVVNKRQKNALKELLGVPIDKVKFFRNYFLQRLESIVGIGFVFIGVGIHLYVIFRQAQAESFQNNAQQALGDSLAYLGYAVLAMIAISILMHWICSYFSRRIFLDILGYLMVRYDYRVEEDPDLLMQIGDMLGVRRAEDDTVQSYTRRIEERMRLGEIQARLKARGKRAARRLED